MFGGTGLLMIVNNSQVSQTKTISFDGSAPAGSYQQRASYTEADFLLQPIGGTDMYSVSPGFDSSNVPSSDGTDMLHFAFGAKTVNLSKSTPFTLHGFSGNFPYYAAAGTFTLIGYLSGGGTISQVFNTLGGNQWSVFTLDSSWTNLTSVDFVSSATIADIDHIVISL